MSVSQEYRLAKSLVWSDQEFSLADFVKRYELPQVVLVVDGYCGVNERTTFSSGLILTLHSLHTTSKIVCQVPHSNAVVVPTSCPLKAEVIPMDCRDTIVTAYQLSTTCQQIKYVRVMEAGSTCNNNSLETLKTNDILQIKKNDSKNSVIRCKNLTTAQDVSILIDSTAVFVPLLDSNTYNLAEIQNKFGLPAKVRFLDKKAEKKLRSVPGKRQPSTYLSDLGQMTAIEEIQESDVIVTTTCSDFEEKLCLNVPTTLDIRITVAEGFLRGDETYQKVVKTLDKQLSRTNLEAFDDLDVYEHMDAVEKKMEDMAKDLSVEDASPDILKHARGHLARVERQTSMKAHSSEKPPKFPPRGRQPSTADKPLPRPPKPGRKPDPKPQKNSGSKLKRWVSRRRSNKNPTSPKSADPSSEEEYEEPFQRPDEVYASIDHISEETISRSSVSEDGDASGYTELDSAYISVSQKPYATLLRNPPKSELTSSIQSIPPPQTTRLPAIQSIPLPSTPQTLPIKPLPQTKEDKEAIYEAISRFPQDLSGLGVADVSRLLGHLNLSDYVQTFENELIDGMMLVRMDQESLESLGVKPFHCKKLLDFIGGWRPRA